MQKYASLIIKTIWKNVIIGSKIELLCWLQKKIDLLRLMQRCKDTYVNLLFSDKIEADAEHDDHYNMNIYMRALTYIGWSKH